MRIHLHILIACAAAVASVASAQAAPRPSTDSYGAEPDQRRCPEVTPIFGIEGVKFYVDQANSVIDPALLAADRRASASYRSYYGRVSELAARFRQSGGKDAASADCAIEMFDAWARAGALQGKFNRQGMNHLKWGLPALAKSYALVAPTLRLDDPRRTRIALWLNQIGHRVWALYPNDAQRDNQLAWAALGAITSGLATNDRELVNAGRGAIKRILGTVTDTGTLPVELRRGQKALNYHVFSLTALSASAAELADQGDGLSADDRAALARLALFVRRNLADDSEIEAITGVTQHWTAAIDARLAWTVPYYRLTGDASVGALVPLGRHLRYPFLGDVNVMFGGN